MIDRPEGGERVILVHLHLRPAAHPASVEEFQELALAAGAEIVGTLSTTREVPDPKFCIGSGKAKELESLIADTQAELVLFNFALTPAQERNLERAIRCRVLDRTGLILDIFAKRARTYEGKLQVEVAQLKHHVSRLVRGWTHLERQKGGIGLRGPGETQLEVDRRLIKNRIQSIQIRLEKVRKQRAASRRARQKAELPTVSLVGYTNAGKSTLFNALTGASVLVVDQVFATLDPTLRTLTLKPLGKIALADTVGFIQQLPHSLVEAFRATLEETQDADLLLKIIDSQDELRETHLKQVNEVLEEIGALAVPCIEVYNKIDLASEVEPHVERDETGTVRRVFISAATGAGLTLLQAAIAERLETEIVVGDVYLPAQSARARARLFAKGGVVEERIEPNGDCNIKIRLPKREWAQLCLEEPVFAINWKQANT